MTDSSSASGLFPVSPATDAEAHLAEIARITGIFFAAFTSGPDCAVRLADLHRLFLPRAILVRTCGQQPTAYDLDGFVAPRQALLAGNALSQFREWEVTGRTQLFGSIAQRFSSYAKRWIQDGAPFFARGMKTLQFVLTEAGWRISAVAWDDERDGLTVPTLVS